MKRLLIITLAAFSVFLSGADFHKRQVAARHLIVFNFSEATQFTTAAWSRDIEARYPGACVVLSHGGDNSDGVWCCLHDSLALVDGEVHTVWTDSVPMVDQIRDIQRWYPGRWVVVLSCNPNHHFLKGVHHVVYADREVWVIPDSAISPLRGVVAPEEAAGNLDQFIVVE